MALPKAPTTHPPNRPTNALHTISNGISTVVGAPAMVVDKFNQGFASATNSIAALFPSAPAATLMSLTMGAPHAHIAHPPCGPPPVPPTPLIPVGPITAGVCIQVLINGMPAARCGDIIMNPTCCGILPLGEVKTGSSNVFIGGARAARQMMDITMHCPVVNSAADRTAAMAEKAQKAAEQASKLSKAMTMVGQVAQGAGIVAQGVAIAGDVVESVQADNSAAMQAALAQNAAMMAAQMAADAVAMALAAAMGKDPAIPPGTPGTIIAPGATNVVIGGFPMISTMNLAKGLLKIVKGLRRRRNQKPQSEDTGNNTCGCR